MPPTSGADLAQHARSVAADEQSDEFLALSGLICWSAVIECGRRAGAISAERARAIEHIDWSKDFSDFVSRDDTRVEDAAAMRRVPPGAFMAFIEVGQPDSLDRLIGRREGRRRIIHAMVSLGGGWAAGNKNLCIGIGNPVGWEILNLADDLNWLAGRTYDNVNAFPINVQKPRPIRIRFREVERFQDW